MVVALPLATAFAIASGVKPERGLFTAVIAGFTVSAFGGSRVQIAGLSGAFIVIVCGIVHTYGYDGLAVGLTSGIVLIIFSSSVTDFLGLRIAGLPPDVIKKWGSTWTTSDRSTSPVSAWG